jgi:hypothetical protein
MERDGLPGPSSWSVFPKAPGFLPRLTGRNSKNNNDLVDVNTG